MATTATFSQAPICDSDANFRLWGKALSDAFAALGLVKDTDAAQIAWATVAKPTAANTMMGYEIWRFNDGALQTACPVFFKIQYGSGNSTSICGIILQVGQGSDSAGTLTGTLATAKTFGGTNSSATLCPSYISSDGGRINVAMFTDIVNVGWAFYIERLKDDTGAPVATGVNILVFGATSAATAVVTQQYLPLTDPAYPATPMVQPMCALPPVGQASYGVNLGLFPILPNLGYAGNPDLGALVYFTGDLASVGTVLSVSLYGATHKFITLGVVSVPSMLAINGNATSHSLAMRYE